MKGRGGELTTCRMSAITQAIFGLSCLVFGIADGQEMVDYGSSFPARGAVGIWMGLVITATGVVGFAASMPAFSKKQQMIYIYFAGSIISTMFALIIADCYIISLVLIQREGDCKNMGMPITLYYGTVAADLQCEVRRKLATVMIVMGLCEIFAGVLAIYTCMKIHKERKEYQMYKERPEKPTYDASNSLNKSNGHSMAAENSFRVVPAEI